ncbi:MAG: hypothetical protein LLG97_19570 [Deltaproteobacteria bacterium]|nr:hypothetical protein [Deltaproteobacteria bacterium]
MEKTWRDYIKEDQLPEDYQLMVDAIGLENTIKLAHALPSVYVYLVSPDKLFKPAKVAYVRDRYANASPENPFNHRRVALETGLSIREVYDILAARAQEAEQPSLFNDA